VISQLFIRRPVLATVCSLIIMLAGAVAIPSLPIARYPNLSPPTVMVTAIYTGANAQAVETTVTTPLEQAINGIEGLMYLTSASTNAGYSMITAVFEVGTDPDLALVNVQNRVNQTLGRMPVEVRTTGILVDKFSMDYMLGVGVFSENGQYDELFMSNYIDQYVRDAIRRVPGVGRVEIFGERKFAMRLWLDPEKLAGRGLTAGDVLNALREQNVQVAAGAIGGAPADPGQAYEMSVRAEGRLADERGFEQIVIAAGRDGALVRLADVGRVALGAENYASALRFGGREASGFAVQLSPTGNAIDTFDGVMAEMAELEKSFPPGLQWSLAFEQVSVVRESIKEVLFTLIEAIGLVVLVLFLFLQNWRSTIIPAFTIPVSLVGTFAFVKFFGFSINTLTLFGIVLATGTVVDDAIVVIENIERHMREYGKKAFRASLDAMREVFSAVVVIGVVLVAVFVPVAFFPGTTGLMYQQFAITIACAVILSVFNAVTLTPALSALLLDKEKHTHGWFFTMVNRVIDGGTAAYVSALRWAISWRAVVLVLFVVGLWGTWWIYRAVPSSFVPEEDEGYLMTIVQAPSGASLEYTSRILQQAEQIVTSQPEVLGAFTVAGFSMTGPASTQAMMFAMLKPWSERQAPEQSLQAVINRVMPQLFGGIPGAIVIPVAPPSIEGLSMFGGFQFQVLDASGGDIANLAGVTQQIVGRAMQSGQLTGLYSAFTANDPQFIVDIDRDRARSMGVPIREVTDALQVFLGSQYVNDFDFNNRAYRVYVQADQAFRSDPGDLDRYYVRSSAGQMVPLNALVQTKEGTAPAVINHFNLFRSAEVQGTPLPGVASGQAIALMEQIADETLPPGFRYAWAGQALQEIRAGSTAVWIFGLSILLVYLVLAAQYESWVLPFIILLAVPLAVFGALGGQLLRGFANDVFCQIGLVMLIGLAAKNSILIVEFAEQLRAAGQSIRDAAVEAARIRLRPILMTSMTFILGVMPLAIATGAGSAARNSVGTTVVGGMVASTFLSIVFIPVLYVTIRTIFPGKVRTLTSENIVI
jgi:HAE1 family hydrophobic/amphiphilic exporter-1